MQGVFEIPADPKRKEALFARARKEAAKEGINLSGTIDKGTFSGVSIIGTIEGTYKTKGTKLTVDVTKKPFLVPNIVLRKILAGVFEE